MKPDRYVRVQLMVIIPVLDTNLVLLQPNPLLYCSHHTEHV
jgi:hypothetical protein